MKLLSGKSIISKSMVFVFLFIVQSGYCLSDIQDENPPGRFTSHLTAFQNVVYKPAQEAVYNMLGVLSQSWIDGEWVNSSKITITYDVQGNRSELLSQSWTNGEWLDADTRP